MSTIYQEQWDKLKVGVVKDSIRPVKNRDGVEITAKYIVWWCASDLGTTEVSTEDGTITVNDDHIVYPEAVCQHPCIPDIGDAYSQTFLLVDDELVGQDDHPTGGCDLNGTFVSQVEPGEKIQDAAPKGVEDIDWHSDCCGYIVSVTWSPPDSDGGGGGTRPSNEQSCNPEDWTPFPSWRPKVKRERVTNATLKGVLVTRAITADCETVSVTVPTSSTSGDPCGSNLSVKTETAVGCSITYPETTPTGTNIDVVVCPTAATWSFELAFYCDGVYFNVSDRISGTAVIVANEAQCCDEDPFSLDGAQDIQLDDTIPIGSCIPPITSCGQLLNYDEEVFYGILEIPIRRVLTGLAPNAVSFSYPFNQSGKCNSTDISISINASGCNINYDFREGTLLFRPNPLEFKRIFCNGVSVCYLETKMTFEYSKNGWFKRVPNHGHFYYAKAGQPDHMGGTYPEEPEFSEQFPLGVDRCVLKKDKNGQPIKSFLDNDGQPLLNKNDFSEVVYGKCESDFRNPALWYGAIGNRFLITVT